MIYIKFTLGMSSLFVNLVLKTKAVIFLGIFSAYEIQENEDKISFWVFRLSNFQSFTSCFLNSYLAISLELLERKS